MAKYNEKITHRILTTLLMSGAIALAMTSPYFLTNILYRNFYKKPWRNKKEKKKFYDMFYYLRKKEFLEITRNNKQIYVYLTEEGKRYAGKYQINDIIIKKPKRWDGKWRAIIFDIPDKQKIKRESLRGKLIELGFAQLQKSVWVHPYDCQEEIKLLKNFFGLTSKNLQFLLIDKIEDDSDLVKKYDL